MPFQVDINPNNPDLPEKNLKDPKPLWMISSKNKSYNNELIKLTTLDERKSSKKNILQLFNLALKGKWVCHFSFFVMSNGVNRIKI